MPLQHVNWAANQRVELGDMNAIGDLGLANLTLLAKSLFAPGVTSQVVRGGRVSATDPASKNVLIAPLVAVNPSGAVIVLESEATNAIADNASGNDRIDLVSVFVAQVDGTNESRKFWNPSTETSFDSNTDTRTEAVVTVTVTQGVPSATPDPPATPAGHVALAKVLVVNGMTSIVDDDITMLEPSFVPPVKYLAWNWGTAYGTTGIPQAVPYTTPALLTLNVPDGQVTVIWASVIFTTLQLTGVNASLSFDVETWDGATATVIGRAYVQHPETALELQSANIIALLPGGAGEVEVRLKIDETDVGTAQISLAAASTNRIVAVTL